MCGVPGSGKSTFVKQHMEIHDEWVSRDKVRFSLVREDEEYFSHEDDVFDTFINWINQALENPEIENVFVDATHLNDKSRYKTVSKIKKDNIEELNCICMVVPLMTCLERNEGREGRTKVPRSVIRRMFYSYEHPTTNEYFDNIYLVDSMGRISMKGDETNEDLADE